MSGFSLKSDFPIGRPPSQPGKFQRSKIQQPVEKVSKKQDTDSGTDEKLVSKAVDVEDDMQNDINVNVDIQNLGLDESAAQVVYRAPHDLKTSKIYVRRELNLLHDDGCGINGDTFADEALL